MRFDPILCPECGEPAIGTLEQVFGVALFDGDPTERPVEYTGRTEVWWEGQMTVEPDKLDERLPRLPKTAREGAAMLVCADGHDWPAWQLV